MLALLIGLGVPALIGVVVATVIIAMAFRVVVGTNEIHMVQRSSKTTSYGTGCSDGNVYYKWPSWAPLIGVTVTKVPVAVFDIKLNDYAAYDKERLPFVIDIMAFFRSHDPGMSAQRVNSIQALQEQLKSILQGAARSILAKSGIEEILEGRSQFGEMFTHEVDAQLVEWGVKSVKTIELMDIRDAAGSSVIQNIMAKKKSLIEMQSRVEVANNIRTAQQAEIDANQQVKVREQEALEAVGRRTAEKEQQIGVANAARDQEIGITQQRAQQAIQEEARATAEKQMAVQSVNRVRSAEIEKNVQVVAAQQVKEVAVVHAEGNKAQAVLEAEGRLAAAQNDAKATETKGRAEGEAQTAINLAAVTPQITLAKEIGENTGYQQYLVTVKQIEATRDVGMKQAEALGEAEIKVIAQTGSPPEGLKSVMDAFSAKGGVQIGAMLEGLKETEVGAALIDKFTGGKSNGAARR